MLSAVRSQNCLVTVNSDCSLV